jgi:hypothetical protein
MWPVALAPAGKCKEFLSSSVCKEVEAGEGAVADCIGEAISAAEAGEDEAGACCCAASDHNVVHYSARCIKAKQCILSIMASATAHVSVVMLCVWVWHTTDLNCAVTCCRKRAG